jgi:poly(hydroxyalkanoate) depolymerase family esterase
MSLHTISDTIERALRSAGLDPANGTAKGVTETIRRALAAAGLAQDAATDTTPARARQDEPLEVVERVDTDTAARFGTEPRTERDTETPPAAEPVRARPGPAHGVFVSRTHTGPAGSRPYKLFVPGGDAQAPRPLVVMLHGCKQNPDDFAAGTRMNELAEQHGFLVAYPAQSRNANGSNCWNWFRPEDQRRDGGEPAILAGIVADVSRAHRVDPARVFVAGLSAGAAMAVILGQTYPDVFAAVGAHSGLPVGAAHDVGSAFMAMSGAGLAGSKAAPASTAAPGSTGPRTIVFHGDQDATVVARNGAAIVSHALAGDAPLKAAPPERASAQGRSYTRTVYTDAGGRTRVEQWLLHGGAHAWSGGSAAGSFTDPTGPDASAEMVRFFLERG